MSTVIRGDWTDDDLGRIAGLAADTHWSRAIPRPDRYAAAWSAAAEALCVPGDPPSREGLLRAARDGITALGGANRRFYGLSQGSGFTQASAGFAKYWGPQRVITDSYDETGEFHHDRRPGATWRQPPLTGWEEAVTDRIALGQALDAIAPVHRETLQALADAGDQRAAAAVLGIGYAAYRIRLGKARNAFRVLWHEGEAPSRPWGRDRRVFRAGEEPKGTAAQATTLAVTRRRQRERARDRRAAEAERNVA